MKNKYFLLIKRKKNSFLLLTIIILAFSAKLNAQVAPDANGRVYVKQNETGTGNSWDNAVDLAEALNAARTNTDIKEIWAASGTYYPGYVPITVSSTTDRDKTFYLPEGIKVYGGFAGTEMTLSQRILSEATKTILSGDINKDNTSTGNAYHVVLITANNVELDGFTIQGGYANTNSSISVDSKTISRMQGAGMHITGSNIVLNHLTVADNSSENSGGGIYVTSAGSITLTNSIVSNNSITSYSSQYGGGISFGVGNYILKNVLIHSNTSRLSGTDVNFSYTNATFTNVTIVGNNTNYSVIVNGDTDWKIYNSVITRKNSTSTAITTNSSTFIITAANSYLQGTNASDQITLIECLDNQISDLGFKDVNANDYHLDDCSVLINSGNNDYAASGDKDLEGNNRINHDIVDIGAYEYQGTLFPLHQLSYNNPADPGQELLFQNVKPANALEDILFYYGGGATDVKVDGLPVGLNIVKENPIDERTPFKISGIPNDNFGIYNFIVTTIGPTNECTAEEAIEGTIIISPDVIPDEKGVLYVMKGAGGKGSSWENAVGELSVALLATEYSADISQIWVGRGNDDFNLDQPSMFIPQYHIAEVDADGNPTTDYDKTFLILNGIKLYGGFDPQNGVTDLTHKRDSSLTVLSGRVDNSIDPPYTVYHVVTAFNQSGINENEETNHITIDGFTITAGNANGAKSIVFGSSDSKDYTIYQNLGAGIYAESGEGFITITGNNIHNNVAGMDDAAGGGIFASGYVQIVGNRISNNRVSGSNSKGGGIAGFYKDSGGSSGGVSFAAEGNIQDSEYRALYVAYNQILNNTVSGDDVSGGGIALGKISNQGGGESTIALALGNQAIILNNIITDNKVESSSGNSVGGGISVGYLQGGASGDRLSRSKAKATINGNIVIGYNWIGKNEVRANSNGIGGGIYVDELGWTNIVNNVVVENAASSMGGGIFVNRRSDGIILNNTISTNTASSGAGVYYEYDAYFQIYNSIVYGNVVGEDIFLDENEYDDLGVTYISHNLIGTVEGNVTNPPADSDSDGNIVGIDPQFIGGLDDDRYSIKAETSSPGIDAGANEYWIGLVVSDDLDFAGNARIRGNTIDIGAYEAYMCPTEIIPDNNGIVYVKDYTMPNAGIQPADTDGSSWEKASPSLADVLRIAFLYPNCIREIWVAEGTYYPKYDYNGINVIGKIDSSRMATFRMPKDVKIYGGFAGNETSLYERIDPNPLYGNSGYISILSGDIDNNTDPDDYTSTETYKYSMGNEIDLIIYSGTKSNSYNVVFFTGDMGITQLDGFTIQGGNADAGEELLLGTQDFNKISGGGVSFGSISYPLLENISIRYNQGVYNGGLSYIDFEIMMGGEESNLDFTTPLKANNIVINKNISPIASAVFSTGYIEVSNFDIASNEQYVLSEPDGTMFCIGKLNLRNGKITDNKSYHDAVAVFPVSITEPSYRLANVTISNNKSTNGAGLAVYGTGGGVSRKFAAYASGENRNNLIEGYIHNTIISGNTYEYDDEEGGVNRAIVSGERNVRFSGDLTKHYIQNSLIVGSGGSSSWNTDFGNNQGGNIDTEPRFLGTGRYAYQLDESSPAINAGDNQLYIDAGGYISTDLDIAGRPRLIGVNIDMGAYEGSCPVDSILYVNAAIPFDGDGSSWSKALNSLADAMKIADRCLGVKEIWVAEGTYLPKYDLYSENESNGRQVSFLLPDNVHFYGGFPADATDEVHGAGDNPSAVRNDMTKRNWEKYPTILSGDIGVKDDYSDNAYHVVVSLSSNENGRMDGFTITGGNANYDDMIGIGPGDHIYHRYGGGIYISNSSLELFNMNISGNITREYGGWEEGLGGGVYIVCLNQAPSFVNVLISGNVADKGAGIYSDIARPGTITAAPLFTNITVVGNRAVDAGGGIYSSGSTDTILNSIIWGNGTENIYNLSQTNLLNFTNSLIEGSGGSTNWNTEIGIDGGGNLDKDPLFVNASASDYQLSVCSPAIDAGNNAGIVGYTTDLAGMVRLWNAKTNTGISGTVDMGAYEFIGQSFIPDAPVLVSANNRVCEGVSLDSTLMSAMFTTVSDIGYKFYTNSEATIEAALPVEANVSGHTFYVRAILETGCKSESATTLTITVDTLPTLSAILGNNCDEVIVLLTGNAPWEVSYSKKTGIVVVEETLVINENDVVFDDESKTYLYTWDISPSTPVTDSIVYTLITLEDANCEGIILGTGIIVRNKYIAVNIENFTNVSCNGISDGTISITATNGYGSPYQYCYSADDGDSWSIWTDFGLDNTNVIEYFRAGTYIIKVRDKVTCESNASDPVIIYKNSIPVITGCFTSPVSKNMDIGSCYASGIYAADAITVTGYPTPVITYSLYKVNSENQPIEPPYASGVGTGYDYIFPSGTTRVVITASNSCGQTTCSFDVIITDSQAPSINCAVTNEITKLVDVNQTYYTAANGALDASATDNCSLNELTFIYSIDNGTPVTANTLNGVQFAVGTHDIEWTVTDAAGLSDNCSFTLVVVSGEIPVIVCANNSVISGEAKANTIITLYKGTTALATVSPIVADADGNWNVAFADISGLNVGDFLTATLTENGVESGYSNAKKVITSYACDITSGGTAITAVEPHTEVTFATVTPNDASSVSYQWILKAVGTNPLDAVIKNNVNNTSTVTIETGCYPFVLELTVNYDDCVSECNTTININEAEAPLFNTPICAGTTTISGIGSADTPITLYLKENTNETLLGSTTTNASGAWTITVTATLAANDTLVAKAGICKTGVSTEVVKALSVAENNITTRDTIICIDNGVDLTTMVSSIGVTNAVFHWYTTLTGSEVLSSTTVIPPVGVNKYYVSVSGDNMCEGEANATGRDSVVVTVNSLSTSANINISGETSICSGGKATLEATAIDVTNPVFNWYATETGGIPFHTGSSYTTGELTVDSTFYVSVSGDNYCEGTIVGSRKPITVKIICYTLRGTIFPFVNRDNSPDFNKLFVVTANLYTLPTSANPFEEIKTSTPLYIDTLILYDGTIHVPGTPKYPGVIGNSNNPGVPVTWSMVGKETGNIDDTEVGEGEKPEDNVGLYTFKDVQPGDYLLVISRPGYVTRYAKINVTGNGVLGHRELLAGDINDDGTVSVTDLSLLNANFSIYETESSYNVLYDLDGEGNIDPKDVQILLTLLRVSFLMYTDSYEWLINY